MLISTSFDRDKRSRLQRSAKRSNWPTGPTGTMKTACGRPAASAALYSATSASAK